MIQLALLIALGVGVSPSGSHDYATAYKQTTESGQPLVVLIGADWCPGCQQMKNVSIPELEKRGGLEKVSFAVVNTDRERELAGKLMRGGSIPQLVVFNKTDDGWKRKQMTGAHSAGEIQAFIEQAADAGSIKLTSRD